MDTERIEEESSERGREQRMRKNKGRKDGKDGRECKAGREWKEEDVPWIDYQEWTKYW